MVDVIERDISDQPQLGPCPHSGDAEENQERDLLVFGERFFFVFLCLSVSQFDRSREHGKPWLGFVALEW